MKKLLILGICILGLISFGGFQYYKAQQLDRYIFKRTTDGFFNTYFKLKPFGGGPYEVSEDAVYMEGVYIVQNNKGTKRATYAGAAGTVTKIDGMFYTLSLKVSEDVFKILPTTVIYVSVPEADTLGAKKETLGKIDMIEVGDKIQCVGLDIENTCGTVYLVKSFYDRTKF